MVCIIDKQTTSYAMQVKRLLISKLKEEVINLKTMHALQISNSDWTDVIVGQYAPIQRGEILEGNDERHVSPIGLH
jgi:hypothetical protein